MNKAMRIFGVLVPALLAASLSMQVQAVTSTVTAATGGGAISNSNIATATWTALTGPSLAETSKGGNGDIAVGSIILNAPAGFKFNTAATVTVAVSRVQGAVGTDIILASNTATVATSTITIDVAVASTGLVWDMLTWSGIQVMPTGCTPLASGNITESGTSSDHFSSSNFGTLTETGSTALTYIQQPTNALINTAVTPAVTLNACGSGAALPAVTVALTVPAGAILGGTLSATTSNATGLATFSNLSVNLAGTYTLTATSPGLTSGVSSSFIIYNPVPTTTSISPVSANTGAASFIMTVNGTNFVSTSAVYFAGTALTTTYVSATQLTATVPAGLLITAGTYSITVLNPVISGVGGGTSNAQVFTVISPVSSFNAFETATAAGAITGVIKTKVAGSAFSLDVAAISGGAQAAGFTNAVKVELLGNTVTGIALDAQNCPVSSTLLQTVAPNPTINAGRSTVSFAAVADAWKDVRVRISYPAAAPTVISCSADNFAIRPNSLSVSVTDTDWQTAGIARTLNNIVAITATPIHKAGQPFTVQATAQNAAAVTTTNYTGTPTIVLSACAGTGCTATLGTFSIGAGTAAAGVINSNTASYSEVGSFNLTLQDTAFASVDSGDTASTCAGYYICSPTIPVGRFVPDHFAVSAASVYNRSDFCALGCGTFTYMGEPMSAVFTLTAQAAGGSTTQNYAGALAKLIPTAAVAAYTGGPLGLGVIDTSAPRTPFPVCAGTPAHPCFTPSAATSGSFASGVATGITVPLTVYRGATAAGPFAALNIGIAPLDSDGVNTIYDLDTTNVVAGASDHTNLLITGNLLYGRINISNAHGSELLQLPIAVTAQYWNGTSYLTNTQDSATTLSASTVSSSNWTNITPGNWQKLIATSTWPAGATSVVPATASMAFGSGKSSFTLTAPGTGITGSVDMIINSTIAPTYLPSNTARATFGVYKGAKEFIYLRENY